jgi:23S rRNA pseudouridine1911/1915/1917 synthase
MQNPKRKKCMEILTLQPNKEDAGTRLDAWLAANLEDITRSAAARLLEEGRVTLVGGKSPAKNYKVTGSETIEVCLPDPAPVDVAPQEIPLDVVYEDGDVIVVNKPKGLVVHPAPGHPDGTLVNALLHHCGESLSGIGGELRPGIVHRIDRDTSGLIIAAKNDFAHQKLAAQLQDHTLARVYRCIVTGRLKEDAGTVDAPIGRHPADRKKMAVVSGGRSAVTHWRVLERFPGFTYVECRLETGRTHQIRVHMAYTGHPILGDTVYGAKKPVPGLRGQCLHAVGLTFLHPRTGEEMELKCGLPEEFENQLRKLRSQNG